MADTLLDTGNSLLTLAELKVYFGLSTGASTTYDRSFKTLINDVSWQFNSYTNRHLKSREITEYRDGTGTDTIFTNEFPIVSASTSIDIRVDTDRGYSTGDKIGSTSIVIYSTEGKITIEDDTFDAGEQSVKIVYEGGYSTIPWDLRRAAREMCRVLWEREKNNSVGRRSESYEGASITYEPSMPWSVKDTLDKYRDPGRTNG